jgi:uncharacterized protein
MRWLHIYMSMLGLAIVLFFSVTGITLNHPQWFYAGAERRKSARGAIDVNWLKGTIAAAASDSAGSAGDPGDQVKKLEIVEQLRKAHAIAGALAEFRVDESECLVSFKGPGYAADAFIDRQSGRYNLTETYHGLVALLNDLHKGRDTGPVWSAVIDISAGLMTLISLSGFVLLFYLKLRRVSGFVVALAGAAVALALYRWWVP